MGDDVGGGRSVIEGAPITLEPTLSVVPVIGLQASTLGEGVWSIALEALALILARPGGVAQLALADAGAYLDATTPGVWADAMRESTRQQCVDAVFGPPVGDGGAFRLPIRRVAGTAEREPADPSGIRITIQAGGAVDLVIIENGQARVQPP